MSTGRGSAEAFIEVNRPIMHGDGFLDQVRHVGVTALGIRITSSVTEIGVVNDEPAYVNTPVGRPQVEVVSDRDFCVRLLRRSVPGGIGRRATFNAAYQATRLAGDRKKEGFTLAEELDLISAESGFEPGRMGGVKFDGLAFWHIDKKTVQLGILPSILSPAARVLQAQSAASYRRLAEQSRAVGLPQDRDGPVGAYLCEFPASLSGPMQELLISRIHSLLPVHFTIGEVRVPSQDTICRVRG